MIERQSPHLDLPRTVHRREHRPTSPRLLAKYIEELEEDYDELERRYREVEEKREDLERKRRDTEEKHEELERRYKEIEEEREELGEKYKDAISEIQRLRDENRRLQDEQDRLKDEQRRLQEERKGLEDHVDELERELETRDQSSSSLSAPSSKVFPKSNRPPRGSRPGGAPKGHRGASLEVPREADEVVVHSPDRCPRCGGGLGEESEGWSQTVMDIPPAPMRVTRHEYRRRWCPHCKQKVSSPASDVLPNRNYGPNLATMVSYLEMLGIPLGKIQLLIETLHGHKVSTPALMDLSNLVGRALEPEYRRLLDEVKEVPVVYADETNFRIDGMNSWCWDFVWDAGSVYVVDRSRGKAVPQEVLGVDFQGLLGRDGWPGYDTVGGLHQLCLIHVNRMMARVEVKRGVKERGFLEPEPVRFKGRGRPSNALNEYLRFAELLRTIMRDAVRFSEREPVPTAKEREGMSEALMGRLDQLITGGWSDADAVRICKFLRKHRERLFTFVVHPEISWENNAAERGVKKVATIRNNSGGRRSREGADTLQALLSVFETWKKRGLDVYSEAKAALLRSVGRPSVGHAPA
jgi:transposase